MVLHVYTGKRCGSKMAIVEILVFEIQRVKGKLQSLDATVSRDWSRPGSKISKKWIVKVLASCWCSSSSVSTSLCVLAQPLPALCKFPALCQFPDLCKLSALRTLPGLDRLPSLRTLPALRSLPGSFSRHVSCLIVMKISWCIPSCICMT